MAESLTPITFEQAITMSQALLDEIEADTLVAGRWETSVRTLVGTRNGARGFFVAYLTDPRPFADNPTSETVEALRSSPDVVAELLVKNLVMSTAMEMTHLRGNDPNMAQQSAQVRDRSANLIQMLKCDRIRVEAHTLWQGLTQDEGDYGLFLKKWGYDVEQRQAMMARLSAIFPEFKMASP